jgi:outer membrane immunogenic protein
MLALTPGYGVAVASVTASSSGISTTSSETLSGAIGGVQIGGNYQIGWGVLGLEVDFNGTLRSHQTVNGAFTETDRVTWVSTIREHIGAAFDRLMVYATIGGGAGEFSANATLAGFGSASGSKSRGVGALGLGAEYGINENLSARLEWIVVATPKLNLATIGTTTVTGYVGDSLLRVGLNYRLPAN